MKTESSGILSGIRTACLLGLLVAGWSALPAMADRQGDGWQLRIDNRTGHRPSPPPKPAPAPPPRRSEDIRHFDHIDHDRNHYRSPYWDLDMRFRHNRYYPRRGYIVDVLPPGYVNIVFRGDRYFFQAGVWFRAVGPNYVVTMPPFGIVVPVLPPVYTTVWLDSVPYYYANDVYYVRRTTAPGYVVVEPPVNVNNAVVDSTETIEPVVDSTSADNTETAIKVVPAPTGEVETVDDGITIVYPNKGQSLARMERDRKECAQHAAEMSGYDPVSGNAYQLGAYQRTLRSCLEGRDYTVK